MQFVIIAAFEKKIRRNRFFQIAFRASEEKLPGIVHKLESKSTSSNTHLVLTHPVFPQPEQLGIQVGHYRKSCTTLRDHIKDRYTDEENQKENTL